MGDLPKSTLGRTGLDVTKLGYGAMELRNTSGSAPEAGALLNEVLDCGINFIDTSPDYGTSEELIGQFLAGRRDEFFLASKCGCRADGSQGEHVFTRENVRAGVERSLRRMRTDHLDLVQVHISPSRETLEEHGTIEEMLALRDEGKLRFLGMSGTLPHLPDHIAMGVFDAFQIPYSGVEREHETVITQAADAGAGIVIRGGVAKGLPTAEQMQARAGLGSLRPGLHPERVSPTRAEAVERGEWFRRLDVDDLLDGASPTEFMLRFTISHPSMNTTIVGTRNPLHLRANLDAARKGPLTPDVYEEAKRRLA
jgi:aryl-alcohol dehydrogenase-like predicted oxidoreductase